MNIIFDFGVVLLDLDFSATNKAFHTLGAGSFEQLYAYTTQSDLFNRLEVGAITEDVFCEEVRSLSKIAASNTEIVAAWNALLLNLPLHRMEMLKALAKEHTLYLLSNTNHIHKASFLADLDKTYGKGIFESLFQKLYYSCNIGLRKPNQEIYHHVIADANLDLNNTIFIDDNAENVRSANACGLKGLLLSERQDITALMATILNPIKQ